MKIFVTITKELDDDWAAPGEYEKMSDADIVELVQEDLVSFCDGAAYLVERQPE